MATPNDTPPGTATPAGSEKRQRSPLSSRTADAPPRKAARTEPVESEEYRDRHDRDSRSSPRSLEHRISAASEDAPRARGPTATERRQSYDDRLNGCYPSYDRYYDDRYSRDSRGYDQYAPRAPNGGREQQQHRGQGQKQTGFRGKRGK